MKQLRMNGKLLLTFVVMFFVTVLVPPVCSAETMSLRIGVIPAENIYRTKEEYRGLIDHFKFKLGVDVELFTATDYTGVIEAMRSGKIDVAFFGPLSYVLAVDKAHAEVIVKENRKKAGSMYEAYIVTYADSDIHTIQDLKGHSFSYVDPASTGGHLVPRLAMVKNGIDPEKDLKSVIYAGGHDASLLAVKNKKVDAGAIVNVSYNDMKSKGIFTEKDVRIIFISDPFPGSAWAVRRNLPDDMKTNIQNVFLNLHKENPTALEGFAGKVLNYEKAYDSEWDVIREMAKILKLDLSKS